MRKPLPLLRLKQPSNFLNCHRLPASAVLFFFLLLAGCGGSDDGANAEEELRQGMELLSIFDFNAAYGHLTNAQAEFQRGSEPWIRSTYGLALAAWHKSPPDRESLRQAMDLFEELVRELPADSETRALALMDIGRILEVRDFNADTAEVEAAKDYYRQVIREYPASPFSARASIYLAQATAKGETEADFKEAARLIEEEIAKQDSDEWISVLSQFLGTVYTSYLQDYDAALEAYLLSREKGFARESEADRSLYQIGQIAEMVGRDLDAAEVYKELVEDYPASDYGTVARQHLKEIAARHPEADIEVPELSQIKVGR